MSTMERQLLRYDAEAPAKAQGCLQLTHLQEGDTVYSGQSEYAYMPNYPITSGIKKGLGRARSVGLVPDHYANTPDAFLETSSNNLLPGLSDDGERAQFVKFRGGTSLKHTDDSLAANLLIGHCLFGEFASTLTLSTGSIMPITSPKSVIDAPVVSINTDDQLSVYEHDSMSRESAFVKSLTSSNTAYRSVTLGLPRVEYYLHLLDAYNAGLVDPGLMLGWFDAVDSRHAQVVAMLKQRLPAYLEVHVVSPLDELSTYIRHSVERKEPINSGAFLPTLMETDVFWQKVASAHPPTDIAQLRTVYAEAVEELRDANDGTNARVVIKGPKEERAFELASKIGAKLNRTQPLVAMYALPQIITRPQGVGLYRIPVAPTAADIELINNQY